MKLASPAARARLFNLLLGRIAKGILEEQALRAVSAERSGDRMLRHARQALDRGQPFTRAGITAGLFSPLEATLVDAAIAAGKLPVMLRRLAMRLEGRIQHGRALRRRLLVAVPLFLLAVLLLPLPLIEEFGLPGRQLYLLLLGASLGGLVLAVLVLPRVVDSTRFDADDGLLSEVGFAWHRLAAAKRRRNAASFLEALGLLLQLEVPLESALVRATLAASGDSARNDFKRIAFAISQKEALEVALARSNGLDPVSRNVLASGAATGRLAEFALQRGAQLLDEIRAGDLLLVKRFARSVYGFVLLWLVADLLV